MQVAKIRVKRFMAYDDAELELPDRGVVLLTGNNGEGKSTFIEAVAAAGWKKTLRGTPPWRDGESGAVDLVLRDGTTMRRSVTKGGASKLEWELAGEARKFESSVKAQDALDRIIGEFDVWSRCFVFSASDAAAFSGATDAARKDLLERLFGLDRFAPALKACREDLRAAKTARDGHLRDVDRARQHLARAREDLDAARAVLSEAEGDFDPAVAEKKIAALRDRADTYAKQIREMESRSSGLRDRSARAGADLRAAEKRAATLGSGMCPTCAQPIPDSLRAQLAGEVADARAAAEAADAEVRSAAEAAREDIEEMREERGEVQGAVRALEERVQAEARRSRQRASAGGLVRRLADQVETITRDADAATGAASLATRDVELLESVEQVLGLRGVRAHVLGRGLAGLAEVANGWLRVAGWDHLRIELASHRDLKSGRTRDEIDMSVVGAGGGHNYGGSSGGERRRVDVCLLMALAMVGAAAHGAAPGTLWFDEPFDTLDQAGLEGIARVLREIGRHRCVVVISHRPELAGMVDAAIHYRVAGGHVTRS